MSGQYTFTEAVSEDYSGVNRIFIMLFVAGVVYWLCLVIVECCVPDNWAATYESDTSTIVDPDVEAEAERVRDLLAHHFGSHHRDDSLLSVFYNEVLLVKNLTKQFCFKPVTIDHITFEVGRNECFGILGIKGAGKTTIFQMLNGNLSPSEGNAFVFGASLRRDRKKFLSQIGYCPKKDALVDQLTAWEMVLLFARIRGIDDDNLSSVVDATLKRFGVEGYAFKQAESYSPGVRRRVSLALAFLGRPAVVLIDEPTSGLDEASKRQIWQLISSYKARGPSIIIMSPSLEECQALCSRVAVLKKGRFGYIGNCQNLKFKFGSCFKVTLKLPRTADYTQRQRTHDEAVSYMEQKFKDATIEQDEEGYFEYNLPGAPTNNWQKVFALMDAMQQKFKLEDWAAYHVTDKKGFKEFVSEDQDSTEEVS